MEKVGAYTERVTASGEWQGGDVQSGLRATPMKADYFNMLQRELVAVVEGAGIALDKTDDNQLLQAIRRIRGGAAANFGPWAWSESLNGNPGQGHLALNNANPTLATELRISETSADAEDFTQSLSLLRAGDTITFQDQSAVLSYRFRVTNSGVDNGAYRSVPVRHLSGGGGLPVTNAVVSVLLTLAGASDDGLPVGSMIPMPKAGVPTGYLELDGSVQSSATYPDLFAYLGTTYNTGGESAGYFRLPDSRGEFFRGWDHGRGVDAGRALGSAQLDQMQRITGKLSNINGGTAFGDGEGSLKKTGSGVVAHTSSGGGSYPKDLEFDSATSPGARAGSETRGRNLAVMWCIKAWSAPVNQANIDISALAVQVSQLQNMADFAVVYPAGGSKASPANAALNSRYVQANPFPGHSVMCRVEILRNGEWGDPGFGDYTSPGGSRAACGVRATQLGDSIIVQTGISGMTYSSAYSGDPFGSPDTVTTPVPFRVLVWKIKGVIA
ncbi:phage tail protein [Pseudomonas extremaustralis]|uniref:phage tail protein n=1 Tax=Pseudomonas extremaustralis TaxID=359110 RepID=UPI00230756DD|nr:phage tail protein [Pseudomonas extremaustralis]MDB1109699.1 phage tail protein [Pseudomonas extremaustralis]